VPTADEAIAIRPIRPHDSIDELTTLLHRSYAGLGNMGLNYTAVDQSVETTRKRLSGGLAFVAVDRQDRLVGTIVFCRPQRSTGSPWLERPEVAHFGQLAVDPALQQRGIGSRLMDLVEEQARAAGAKEIALDTAEPGPTRSVPKSPARPIPPALVHRKRPLLGAGAEFALRASLRCSAISVLAEDAVVGSAAHTFLSIEATAAAHTVVPARIAQRGLRVRLPHASGAAVLRAGVRRREAGTRSCTRRARRPDDGPARGGAVPAAFRATYRVGAVQVAPAGGATAGLAGAPRQRGCAIGREAAHKRGALEADRRNPGRVSSAVSRIVDRHGVTGTETGLG
jgi:predicted N-acetyltransferase YhbS